jgi:ketosteroid isomerase-like protein
MTGDDQTASDLFGVLEAFCGAFEQRDTDAVMRLVARDPALIVVTSEEAILRGPDELAAFLRRYELGTTTYSWTWDRHDVGVSGNTAWLLAEGWETAATSGRAERHPYRMTMTFRQVAEQWTLVLVHGSSPHQPD